jgi:hypothetical protein
MNRSMALGFGAIVLAVVALWWWSASGGPEPAPPASAEPEALEPAPAVAPAQAPAPQPAAAPTAPPVAQRAAEPEPEPEPEEQQPIAAPAAPPMPPPHVPPGPPTGPVGPVVMLKTAFERDAADPEAASVEQDIRTRMNISEVPKGMLSNVQCHQRSCKLEMTWQPDKPFGYMAAAMLLTLHVNSVMGVEPAGPLASDGSRKLEVFVARKGLTLENFNAAPH